MASTTPSTARVTCMLCALPLNHATRAGVSALSSVLRLLVRRSLLARKYFLCLVCITQAHITVLAHLRFQLVTGRTWRGSAFGGVKGRTELPGLVEGTRLYPLCQTSI